MELSFSVQRNAVSWHALSGEAPRCRNIKQPD